MRVRALVQCRWACSRLGHFLGVSRGRGLAGSGQSLLLDPVLRFPSPGALRQGLLPQLRDKLERRTRSVRKCEVSLEVVGVHFQHRVWVVEGGHV